MSRGAGRTDSGIIPHKAEKETDFICPQSKFAITYAADHWNCTMNEAAVSLAQFPPSMKRGEFYQKVIGIPAEA